MKRFLLLLFLSVGFIGQAQNQTPPPLCPQPTNLVVANTSSSGATFSWTSTQDSTAWEIIIYPAGMPAPTEDSQGQGIFFNSTLFTVSGLMCGAAYDFYVRSICTQPWMSFWATTIQFSTLPCFEGGGVAEDLLGCPENGQFCYNLHENDAPILGSLDPQLYNVSYFANAEDATIEQNPLDSPLCLNGSSGYIVGRLEQTQTGLFALNTFYLGSTDECAALRLRAFIDFNGNGILDATEATSANYQMLQQIGAFNYEVNDDGVQHVVSGAQGEYLLYDANTSNSYDVDFVLHPEYAGYYNGTGFADLQTSATGVVTHYFPIAPSNPYTDLAVTLTPVGSPRPGFQYTQYINYRNNGNQTIASGSLAYFKDAALSFVSASAPVNFTADGFTYDFVNLEPNETRTIEVVLLVPVIPTVTLGQLASSSVSGIAAGDAIADNDTARVIQPIVGAYDPNDKMEAHGRDIVLDDFSSDDYLYYTIRFENTGTASAYTVKITDTLDALLDETTVRMVETSLPGSFTRTGSDLVWLFDGIDLPPTVADPIGSHGYVKFKVKPKPGFAIGTVIPNTASIYFDFNPAIVTNTFETHFVAPLSTLSFAGTDWVVYPNPAQSMLRVSGPDPIAVSLFAVTGQQLLSLPPAREHSLDVSQCAPGIYLLRASDGSKTGIRKVVIR